MSWISCDLAFGVPLRCDFTWYQLNRYRFFFFLDIGAFDRMKVSGSKVAEEVVAGGSVVSGVVAGGGTAEASDGD